MRASTLGRWGRRDSSEGKSEAISKKKFCLKQKNTCEEAFQEIFVSILGAEM